MAEVIKGKVQHRYDTAADLMTSNPTMLAGEIGIESDTAKFKFGDGSTSWNDLPYSGGSDQSWKDDSDYLKGDQVTHNEEQWKALANNTNSEPGVGTDWKKKDRLYWFDYKDYLIGDLAVNDGSLYIAIADNTNIEPGTDTNTWILFEPGDGRITANESDILALQTEASNNTTKLSTIDDNANNYIPPDNMPPSFITETVDDRFVSDIDIANWNGKAEGTHTHTTSDIAELQAAMINAAYPVGCTYNQYTVKTGTTFSSIPPATLFPGTFWESKGEINIDYGAAVWTVWERTS